MVENPANSIAADMAGRLDLGTDTKRIQDLAGKGASDPSSLNSSDIKELCEAILAHLGGAAAK